MDFFAKKIATLFTRFDMDKNGKIEEDDFDTWSSKLVAIGILNPAQSEHLRVCMKSIWTSYFLPADTDHDGSVTVDELIVHMRSAMSDEGKRAAINATLPIIFDAIDANQDDGVSSDEFANYFASMGVTDKAFADSVFKAMDADGDGSLSKEEFSNFGKDFFLSLDESSSSRFFFGPLVA